MKIIDASYEIIRPQLDVPDAKNAIYQLNEAAGRTCYKSEELITPESAADFVRTVAKIHHESVLEHTVMTVRFIVDRGISHELVRHRVASFSQESTRYCNYTKGKFGSEITVIKPFYLKEGTEAYDTWKNAMMAAEKAYFKLIEAGFKAEDARAVLPHSLKTEVVMTANMREWRHVFRLRAAGETGKPHPQMAEVMVPLLKECQAYMPEMFGDIECPE